MEVEYTFDADNHLVRATYSGNFSLPEAEATFRKVLDALVRHQAKKILIDGRAVTGAPGTMERYSYATFVADAVSELYRDSISFLPRFAYVLSEPVLDPRRFGETVAVNRGLAIKMFDNMDEAEQWLEVKPSATADTRVS